MDIYEMMKNGASEDEINEAIHDAIADFSYSFAKQMDAAKERIAAEKAEAEAAEAKKLERDKTLHEARAYMINSLLAYNDVFQFAPAEEITAEVIAKLEEMIIEMEKELTATMKMLRALGNKMDIEDIWRMFM